MLKKKLFFFKKFFRPKSFQIKNLEKSPKSGFSTFLEFVTSTLYFMLLLLKKGILPKNNLNDFLFS